MFRVMVFRMQGLGLGFRSLVGQGFRFPLMLDLSQDIPNLDRGLELGGRGACVQVFSLGSGPPE